MKKKTRSLKLNAFRKVIEKQCGNDIFFRREVARIAVDLNKDDWPVP